MLSRRRTVSSLLVLALVAASTVTGLLGCGSANPPVTITPPVTKPTSVIFVAQPPTSLAVNASATLTAAAIYTSAVNEGSTQVTWSVSCASTGSCGAFSANADGGSITYTAPSAIPSGTTVTVTATSVADPTKSVFATITIVAPIPISVSFFGTVPASVQVNAAISLNATIVNDVSANPQVKWTVTCGSAACGSFTPSTTFNEASTTFTAPAIIPAGNNVTVTATSVTDPTKSASATLLITAAAPTLANGTYVFQLSGPAGNGAAFTTGVLVAKDGAVTGGEQDSVSYISDSDNNPTAYPLFQQITGGSYGTTPDGHLQITVQIGASEVETITGTLASGSKGFVAGLNGTPASGTLDLQTSTAAPSGGYAIGLYGGDAFVDSAWIGGILNIDNAGAISGTGSVLDVDDGVPGYGGIQALGASTVSAPDANGRIEFKLFPATSSTSTLPPIYLVGYIIDAIHIRLIETGQADDDNNFKGVLGGTALAQGASTGQYSAASFAGASYVFGAQGADSQQALQVAGVITAKADSTVTGTLNWNDLAETSTQAPLPFTGSYTVDPTGRVTLTNLTDGATFHYSLHLYLAADGNALVLSNDTADTFSGQAFQQQSSAFISTSFTGNYGLNASLFSNSNLGLQQAIATGSITADAGSGTDSVAGFADNGDGIYDFAITGSFAPSSSGILEGTLTGLDSTSRSTPGNFTLYLVDQTQGILIETDPNQLTLGRLARVQ
jgi:hypothetical protein